MSNPYLNMINPQDTALVLIDYQPAMFQGVESHDRLSVVHNVQVLAKSALVFKLPIVISTVAKDSFSGPFMPEVTELFPNLPVIDRTSINSWLDADFLNKILEYMALGRPIVQFDLREGRLSAGEASLYAAPNDPVSFADCICTLLDDEELRERMGEMGRQRFERDLAWSHQVPELIVAYARAMSKSTFDVGARRSRWWRRSGHAHTLTASRPARTAGDPGISTSP